jgi:hypothetical protein
MRQRATLVKYAIQHVLHVQKALMLHYVVSDITGARGGLRILYAILSGERNSLDLAKLRDDRCKKDATIALALEGNWREEHLFAPKRCLQQFEDRSTEPRHRRHRSAKLAATPLIRHAKACCYKRQVSHALSIGQVWFIKLLRAYCQLLKYDAGSGSMVAVFVSCLPSP